MNWDLPIGYRAHYVAQVSEVMGAPLWALTDYNSVVLTFAQVDRLIPQEAHERYVWGRYLEDKEAEAWNEQ